jgi:hypothetical protein
MKKTLYLLFFFIKGGDLKLFLFFFDFNSHFDKVGYIYKCSR